VQVNTDSVAILTKQLLKSEVEVWKQGILFTDYGRELVKELMEIVKFVEDFGEARWIT
jgi:hypothetical protein